MNLINSTKLQAAFTTATDKTGRESVVVVAKGTYGFPIRPSDEPELLEEQAPLVMCDEFTGEPGFSAPLYEIDFAPHKPRCDVLLNGSAYAPGGKPAERVTVSLRVGAVNKSFEVVGKRMWKAGMLYQGASAAEPFVQQAISYNVAFGGVDRTSEDQAKHRWYLLNHAGKGYFATSDPKALDGKLMPNTEESGRPVASPSGSYKPMAFGPVGRSWQLRVKWAGTYDKTWINEKCPFLPNDFDERYFQAAAEDQQTDYLKGGEKVLLMNLTPQGQKEFRLPNQLEVKVAFLLRSGEMVQTEANVDTLTLEPDQNRFMVVWRARQPVKRTIREIQQIIVGRTVHDCQEEQRRQRREGKLRFHSLQEMAVIARPFAKTQR